MIPSKTEIDVQTNSTGERIKMTLDENSIDHLMSKFIDLYSDPELACVREYATNARDSHIEAGNDAPIIVNTPTSLNAVLHIIDYGVGMDGYDILETYSRYGASTKRESNDYNGTLGLGCKSALAYTNQFTLIGRKDGVEVIVSAFRDEDGAGSMDIVSETQTELPNGVEIMIPAKASNRFEQKARSFFAYWPKGSVLLNGMEAGGDFRHDLKVDETIYVIPADRYAQGSNSRVVMGGVGYPVEKQYMPHGLGDEKGLLAFVDIGTVDFAPNREGLRPTRKTKDALIAVCEAFKAARNAAIQAEISKSVSSGEAITSLLRLRKVFGLKSGAQDVFKYQGRDFPNTLSMPAGSRVAVTASDKSYGQNYNSHEIVTTLDVSYLPNTVFIRDWTQTTFTATTKKKLMKWLEDKREAAKANETTFMKVNHFTLVNGTMPDATWISPERIVDWETIKSIKLPTAGRPVKLDKDGKVIASAGEYEVTSVADGQRDKSLMLAEDFDATIPLFYVIYDKDGKYDPYMRTLMDRHDEFYFVEVWSNREAKFKRLFPHAQDAYGECKSIAKAWRENLSDDVKLAYYIEDEYGVANNLKSFKEARIDDPELKAAIRLANGLVDIKDTKLRMKRYYLFMDNRVSLTAGIEWTNPLEKYPLTNNRSYRAMKATEDEYVYVNAMYAHRVAQQNIREAVYSD
jgi:hypothetical protein